MPYREKGDKEPKVGNLERAIELFDIARYNGYNAPALYTSYAIIYRKLKDYNNEVAIIDEAIERLRSEKINVNQIHIRELKERRAKALALKLKQNLRNVKRDHHMVAIEKLTESHMVEKIRKSNSNNIKTNNVNRKKILSRFFFDIYKRW